MHELERKLPGQWNIIATNFPMWTSKKRSNPSITYGLLRDDPLTLSDLVAYQNRRGKEKTIKGVDTMKDGMFIWRGKGILRLLSSKWSLLGIAEDVLVIRFEKSLVTPAGVDVLRRSGAEGQSSTEIDEELLRTLGLSQSEYQSLTWL